MEHNPELEKAEAELQEQSRREREAKEAAKKASPRVKLKWTDKAIIFTVVMYCLGVASWVASFFICLDLLISTRHPSNGLLVLWLCSLPSAIMCVGHVCVFVRVLDLTGAFLMKPPEQA